MFTALDDFSSSSITSDFFLDSNIPRHCFAINITDDDIVEGNETFTITADFDMTFNTGLEINIDPSNTTIVIMDNDGNHCILSFIN